ncbi:MAG: hypothetical protein ABR559_08305 [Gemmatimonadota bacterium]
MNGMHLIKSVALSAAIVIVLNLFIGMGIKTFYPAPAYETMWPAPVAPVEARAACEAIGGVWYEAGEVPRTEYRYGPMPPPPPRAGPGGLASAPYCDPHAACRDAFEAAQTRYQRNAFIVWVVAGIIALGLGIAISAAPAVASGLAFGGVVAFLVGTTIYWADMEEYLRFLILAVVLAALIWVGYKKMSPGPPAGEGRA